MTPGENGRVLQKQFDQRRAGLLDPDEHADQLYLSGLRILERVAGPAKFLPARPLTPAERELALAGQLAHAVSGEILHEDQLLAREQAVTAKDRTLAAGEGQAGRDRSDPAARRGSAARMTA